MMPALIVSSSCCAHSNFSSLKDVENGSLAPAMNGVVVHSKLVDDFEETLIEQADMSFIWYVCTRKDIFARYLSCILEDASQMQTNKQKHFQASNGVEEKLNTSILFYHT